MNESQQLWRCGEIVFNDKVSSRCVLRRDHAGSCIPEGYDTTQVSDASTMTEYNESLRRYLDKVGLQSSPLLPLPKKLTMTDDVTVEMIRSATTIVTALGVSELRLAAESFLLHHLKVPAVDPDVGKHSCDDKLYAEMGLHCSRESDHNGPHSYQKSPEKKSEDVKDGAKGQCRHKFINYDADGKRMVYCQQNAGHAGAHDSELVKDVKDDMKSHCMVEICTKDEDGSTASEYCLLTKGHGGDHKFASDDLPKVNQPCRPQVLSGPTCPFTFKDWHCCLSKGHDGSHWCKDGKPGDKVTIIGDGSSGLIDGSRQSTRQDCIPWHCACGHLHDARYKTVCWSCSCEFCKTAEEGYCKVAWRGMLCRVPMGHSGDHEFPS